jgi:uncharacterized protein (TIRG00374 family)
LCARPREGIDNLYGALITNNFFKISREVDKCSTQIRLLAGSDTTYAMKHKSRWVWCYVLLLVAALGFWIGYQDREQIAAALRQVGIQGFLFLCLLSSFNYCLRYLRWNSMLKQLGDRVDLWESLMCYLSGFALTMTPAKVGEAIRGLYYKRRQRVDYSHTLASLLTERIMDALAAVLIGTLALYTFEHVRWIGAASTLCVILVVVLVSHQTLLLRLVDTLRVIKVQLLQRLLNMIPVFLERVAKLFQPRPFTLGMVVGVIAWSAEGVAFAWLAQELGGPGSTILYMSIFSIAMVAGALTFLPGGLGGTEVVLYMLAVATGMGSASALTATILIRLATLWYAVFLGLLSLLWLELAAVKYVGEIDGAKPKQK